jgi:hypothetical protein
VFSTNVVAVFTNANDGVILNVGAVRSGVMATRLVTLFAPAPVAVMVIDDDALVGICLAINIAVNDDYNHKYSPLLTVYGGKLNV